MRSRVFWGLRIVLKPPSRAYSGLQLTSFLDPPFSYCRLVGKEGINYMAVWYICIHPTNHSSGVIRFCGHCYASRPLFHRARFGPRRFFPSALLQPQESDTLTIKGVHIGIA